MHHEGTQPMRVVSVKRKEELGRNPKNRALACQLKSPSPAPQAMVSIASERPVQALSPEQGLLQCPLFSRNPYASLAKK